MRVSSRPSLKILKFAAKSAKASILFSMVLGNRKTARKLTAGHHAKASEINYGVDDLEYSEKVIGRPEGQRREPSSKRLLIVSKKRSNKPL